MKMTRTYVILLLSIACIAAADRPNIVLFLVDDMGWKDASCYGSTYYDTPHIDALAKSGVLFTAGYATSPCCSPSRAGILTGQLPNRVGISGFIRGSAGINRTYDLNTQNIGDVLSKAGYQTMYIGKWHVGHTEYGPHNRGFQTTLAVNKWGSPGSHFYPYKGTRRKTNFDVPDLEDGQPGEYLTDRLTTEAIKMIDSAQTSRKPFFLFMSHYAVHKPPQAKKEHVERYKGKAPADGQDSSVYAGMVQSVDDAVGRLRAYLERRRLWKNTIFIFTSDNGGQSMTSMLPLRGKKGSHWEGGVRVPFIMSWPAKWGKGIVSNTLVYGPDIFPTLVKATGATMPKQPCDGIDISTVAETGKGHEDRRISFYFPSGHSAGAKPHAAIRHRQWRLLHLLKENSWHLYDLDKDIGETTNVAATHPKISAQLKSELEKVVAGLIKKKR